MKKWVPGVAIALAVVIIIVISIRSSGPRGEKVYVEEVGRHDLESIVSAPGEVDPKVKVNISAHVIGKIEKLWFEEGDTVAKGQRLVDLEKVAFTAQRDRARSEIANRRIEVDRARIRLADAELAFRRAQSLKQQGIQAEEVYDRARFDLQTAKAFLASAEESVKLSAATVRQAEDDLTRTTLVSPIDGKVVQLSAHEGEVVVTGTMNNPGSVIAVIADLSEILVQADVAETEVVRVKVGQNVRIRIDAVSDVVYEGRVTEIGSSATTRASAGSGVRYFGVKIALVTPDARLRPGMSAQVDIVTDSVKGVVAVPVQCVVTRTPGEISGKTVPEGSTDDDDANQKVVFIVDKEKTKLIEVKTGISDTTHVVITSGLQGGEKIVTGPFRTLKKLKAGIAVQAEKEPRRASDTESGSEK